MTLESILNKFKNDTSWNTENKDGTHRFDKKLEWLENIAKEYAEYFHLSTDEVIAIMENNRTYSWPNYYQEANFASVSELKELIGVFKTFDEFYNYSKEHWKGFKCPRCGNISNDPQFCEHRTKGDGICDWTSFGLFTAKDSIVILENGFEKIPIFEPVSKEIKEQKYDN